MLLGRATSGRLGDAALPEPAHPAVQLPHEVLPGDSRPVGGVEELLLDRAEEPLRAGVVAAHPLTGHAAAEAGTLADGYPAVQR